MKDSFIPFILILWNSILATFLILFVFQRDFYLYSIYPYLSIRDEHKTINLIAEDSNPIDLRFIDNGADTDLFLMFGNITQETLYNKVDEDLKDLKKRCNIFTHFFRGHLGNPGIPSEKSINKDIKVIGEYLKERNKKTIAFGFSFGCNTILRLANITKFDQIILVNPLSCFRDVVKSAFSYLPAGLILVDTWDNVCHIKKLTNTKIQIFTSEEDKIVLPENSETLKQNNEDAKQEMLPGCNHIDIFKKSVFKRILFDFIDAPE